MTASVRRPPLRLRLALGTALAGGTLLVMPVARAQELPSGSTVIVGLPVSITTDAAGKNMDVGLVSGATVINWNTFNVNGVSAADPSTVNFRQTLPNSVVVNRVTSTTPTSINDGRITTYATPGDVSTKQNTTVWLLNRNGILIGGGGAIDAGGFLGSTLDVCAAAACTAGEVTGLTGSLNAVDPLPTDIRLFGAAASTAAVRVTGTSRIATNDALVLVGGAVEVQAGTTLQAGGDVNLVAATDVQVRRAGSPLVFQINAGTQVVGNLVATAGGITGDSVVVAAARASALAEALLSVGGTVTARGVATNARGIVLLGGTGTTDPAPALPGNPAPDPVITFGGGLGGPVGINSTASLVTQAGDVLINGTGAVTVAGDVSAVRDYRVSGRTVTLGAAGAISQSAGGAVSVRSSGGDITGLGGLILRANRDGVDGEALTLVSQNALLFGTPGTTIFAGDGTAAGNSDIRVQESAGTATTTFGAIAGRSLGRVPAAGETSPAPLTLYGATTFSAVTLDRPLDLTVLTGGGTIGSLVAEAITTGVHALDTGAGVAAADDIAITTDGSARFGTVGSLTGNVTVTARNGDVTGVADGIGGFRRVDLSGSVASVAAAGSLTTNDGSVRVFAGRSSAGAQTATGLNGLALLGTVTAGGDVTVLGQKIDATTVQAAAVSPTPALSGAASGTATLYSYAHDAGIGAIDLRVGSVAAGTGSASRAGLDVQLTAGAAGGTVAAATLNADRNVGVLAGTGSSGAAGSATITGAVRGGRVDATGSYSVTAGRVTLGAAGATVEQSARGAVTIRSTLTDITGLGTLTLQANSDGLGGEALMLSSAGAIGFATASRLFAGDGTATGNSDIYLAEATTATATNFGQVRARSLGGFPSGGATSSIPLTLYGPTTFGTVDLDRSLDLRIANGGGGAPGTLTTGAVTLGVHAADDGTGAAITDSLTLTTAGTARFASVTSLTGSLLITAVDGDVTGVASGGGFARLDLAASRAQPAASPAPRDGSVVVLAGRDSSGAQTATGTNGLAFLGAVTAGGDIRVDAQAVDASSVASDRAAVSVRGGTANGFVPGSATEALALGSAVSGLGTALQATAGSVRVGSVDAGRTAVSGTTSGTVQVDAYNDVRAGSITTQVGDVSIRSQHGDITGNGATPAFGRADLATLDGNLFVRADAVALAATPVGLVQLGTVFAQTREAQAGATTAPARGNIYANGRIIDITSAATAGFGNDAGGLLSLTAAEGSGSDDVHLTLRTGFIGTTATLIAGLGSLSPAGAANGTVSVNYLETGRNRLVGPGTALPGTITIEAVNSVRADALTSRTGNVAVTAANGDVSGYLARNGRTAVTASLATGAVGDARGVLDGTITIRAASSVAGRGVATIGGTLAGGDVSVQARTIDGAEQTARSVAGSVAYVALSGDLTLGAASAGADVVLDATADPAATRGLGTIDVGFLTARRNIDVRADSNAAVTGDVAAGIGGAGYYHVTAGDSVVLGDDSSPAALAASDLQSAVDDVRIVSLGGSIIGNRRLVLRSNSAGQADGTGDADGARDLTLDAAAGSVAFALPDGYLSMAARDVDAARLIGGSDAAPRQSAVRVRAAAGTTLSLGNVTGRALRSLGATPVATDLPDFAARAGANPLYHDGDIRVGQVDVAESLGIFAYGGAGSPPRLLQLDGARSRTGNVELYATGELRGYQLTAPSAGTPLGIYVATDLTAGGARVDARASSVLLDDVTAGAFAGIETTAGQLRVATVTTGTTRPIADSGVNLIAQTDLRLTSASAARGDVVATSTTGSVTGLANPDNGTLTVPFSPVAGIEATDGNLTVNALGTGSGTGLVAANLLTAGSGETLGAGAPARGNVSVIGQQIGIGNATARTGSLTLYARAGIAGPIGTGVLLISGSAGTTAGITVDAGGISAPSDANGSAVIGTLVAGTNALSGGATALAGNATVTTAGNIRAGSIESRTGGVTLTARDADVTGPDDGTGVFGRVNLTAATASGATAGALPIANGSIAVYAGRDGGGALTATGTNGLARLGTLTAGGNVTILAQAIDATAAMSANDAIFARAYAADGAVTGSAPEALVLGTATSGLGTVLEAPVGSARATAITTGQLRNGTPGDAVIDAALDIRVDTARSDTGNVTLTARDGDVTGPADAGGFGRANLIAAAAAPASGAQAAVADGNISVYAGRDASGALTATGNAGLAKLGAVTAGGNVTVLAQAIDALSAEATRGTITATAYAADGAVPGSATESLVVGQAASGLGTTLTSTLGSIRSTVVSAALAPSATGDIIIDAARSIRVGTARTTAGSLTATARDGDITGLAAGTRFDRANLAAGGATGDVNVYAGRDAGAALTATGTNGLALLGAVTAGRDVTILAQAIDGTLAQAGRTLIGRAYAADGTAPSTGGESLVLVDALSGLGTTLTSAAGSIRANVGSARATGATGDVLIDAARDVRVGTGQTAAGIVTVTARDGDITGLATASGFGRANLTAGGTVGDVNVYAGRDSAGALTATGANGFALLGTTTAGRDITIRAQAIDATRLEAGRTIDARAYAADGAVGTASQALVLVDALSGLGTTLTASTGSVRAATITAARMTGATGDIVINSARNVRVGVAQTIAGSVTATARDGDITGLANAIGFDRAALIAGGTAGDVGVYAGRDLAGTRTATGSNGLALLDTASAGRDVTILAEAIDATTAEAGGTIDARAYALDGAVGTGGEALVLGDALSGFGTSLTATTGSVRSSTISAARTSGATGDIAIDAARDIRVGTARTATGSVVATAFDGGVSGLAGGRAILDAGGPAGDVKVYAGRDTAGGLTATGANGLALLDTVTARRDITILAQAIDATRVEAGRTIDARAYAADGAVTGSAGEALVLVDAYSGLGTSLTATTGSVRSATISAARATGAAGDVIIDAAGDIRIGTAQTTAGSVITTARDGGVTGLGTGRAILSAGGATGDVRVYAGRAADGTLTATGANGLALLDTVTASRDITILAQAIDANRLEADRTIDARAYAADGTVAGSADEALFLGDTLSGLGTTLTATTGSVRSSTATTTGATGDIVIDAARDIRLGTALTNTGSVTATARDGGVTGLAGGRAILTAGGGTGDIGVYAGRAADGTLTAIGTNGLALLDSATAGRDVTILAQAIDASRLEGGRAITARAFAADDAVTGSGGDSLVLDQARSGQGTTLFSAIGSIRATGVSAARAAGATADILIDAGRNVRLGTADTVAGTSTIVARDGDVTGLANATGFDRAFVAAGGAAGDVRIYAGRNASGALTAGAGNGLALIDLANAGRDVTVLAQAIDASRALAGGAILAHAYAADGAAPATGGESLVLGEARSGLATTLTNAGGSIRTTAIGAGGDVLIDAARDVRAGTVASVAGTLAITARDGDVTGLANGTGFDRTILDAAIGDIGVFAGRDLAGTQTATGTGGLALIDTATGRDVTILAQAIDATRFDTRAITARAYAADGAAPATGGESLVVVDALSRLGTTLTSAAGSVRATNIDAGRSVGGIGDVLIDAQRNVRLGTAATATGGMTVTARDGDLTGLVAGAGFGRAILSTSAGTGDISVNAGRDSAGELTATGSAGLALLDTVAAGRDLTIQAQAIDARSLVAGRALAARAYAADSTVTTGAADSLLLDTAGAGAGITLASGGSFRATTVGAGQVRNGVVGDLVIDAARNVTLATGTTTTGNVSITARDGTVAATTLTAGIGSIAQGTDAAIADGNVAVYAGRDASGALTATGGNGLARLGTVTAGNDVTVLAQTIDANTVQAAAVSATPLPAGAASGTATLHAYAHDTTPGATDLGIATISAGTASTPRRGLDVILIADAPGGTLRATTVNADRNISVFAGSGTDGEATLIGEVRAGRSDPAGTYSVTAGLVTLGTVATPVEQSARGAVAITSAATDIVGLGTLTLQSNSDGPGREPLTLRAARGIVLTPESRLFAGTDTAAGTSDILVAEGSGATLTTFGQVRGRSLGGIPSGVATAPVPLTLYGATTFGTVELDRSLDLTVVGPLTTGPVTVGRYPASGVVDTITISASGPTRFASLTSRTGGVAVGVTGAGQSLTVEGPIEAVGAILLNAAQDVTTTTVTSSAGRVAIGATSGTASGDRVTASGGNIDATAGTRAAYTTLAARDTIAVTAGTIGVTTATAGTSLAMTATGADTGAADGEALVLTTGSAGTAASLTATTGSVRATTVDSGQARDGTVGGLAVTAARNITLETARSATGNVTVTARDGTVAAGTLTAAIASTPQGPNAAIADGSVAVYAGRDASGALTATGSNGFARLGTVTAGNNVTVLAQKIDTTTVQAAAVSATPIAAGAPSGSATLTAYAHDAAPGAIDLRVGSVAAGAGSATRRGQDVVLAASATGGTLQATTLDADRNVSVTAGSGTNGAATVSGAVRAGRVDPTGTYVIRAAQVTLGTAAQTIEQSAAAATSVTATAGGVSGLGTLTLQSNRDGTGAEALEVRAAGGNVVFDPTSTLRGGQAPANGSNVTVAATGTAANIDVGAVAAIGSTATLQADGSVTTRGPLTAATASLQAGGAITTNGTVSAPTVTFQTGTSATVNGALSATTATLRAVGRVTTTAPITATTLTVQSSQVSFNSTLNATTIGLYNQASTANRTRLGGTTSTNETAFEVDQNEFNRITATNLLVGSGADDVSGQPLNTAWLRQDVDIGSLAIAAGTGSAAIKVLGTAAANVITVNGAVSINGGTASRTQNTRILQLGGAAANTTSEIGQIRIVNDDAATGNTGSIATGGGVLDLRAALILVGKQAFVDDVTRAGVDLNRNFISNPNSSLYGTGPNGYLTTTTPVELVTTGQLRLQFSNVALFQNTSRPGAIPTGVTITGASSSVTDRQPLVLRSGSAALANGFALFGKFQPSATETFFSTQAALLGSNFISNGATGSNGVNPVSARLNGCLLSSASGGCLASSIAQPTLNVFDVTRDQVLRGSDNLVVTFDPLVGSNNEALFGDIAAGDFDLQQCPDGTTAVQCKPSGDAKP